MKIIPAIDLLGGKVVRLYKGKKDKATIYSRDPMAVAKQWITEGADTLHIVDLDAAFGQGDNLSVIKKILKFPVEIEVGGGIASEDKVKELVNLGARRVILGTKALEKKFFSRLVGKYPDKICASIDCYGDKIAVKGWRKTTETSIFSFLEEAQEYGLRWVIYTDISRDGTLSGPNFAFLKQFSRYPRISFILSGGVSAFDDLTQAEKEAPFLWGIIVGKALYEGKINLAEAIRKLKDK